MEHRARWAANAAFWVAGASAPTRAQLRALLYISLACCIQGCVRGWENKSSFVQSLVSGLPFQPPCFLSPWCLGELVVSVFRPFSTRYVLEEARRRLHVLRAAAGRVASDNGGISGRRFGHSGFSSSGRTSTVTVSSCISAGNPVALGPSTSDYYTSYLNQ